MLAKTPLLLTALASPLFAQTVIVVDDDPGPGVDHTNLQLAIDAAAPGSTLLVKDGTYAAALVNGKSLVITGEAGGDVTIQSGIVVRDLGPTDTVTLRELDVYGRQPMILLANEGLVWIENCELFEDSQGHPILPAAALHIVYCDRVVVRDTRVRAGHAITGNHPAVHGMIAAWSSVYVYEFTAYGSPGYCTHFSFADPGDGAFLYDATLFASNSTFQGGIMAGAKFCMNEIGGAGIRLDGVSPGSQAFLSNSAGIGGAGDLLNLNGPDIDTVLGSVQTHTEPVREFEVASPIRADQSAQLTFRGEIGDQILVMYGLRPSALYLPLFFDALHLPLPVNSFYAGQIDFTGERTISLDPDLPPGVESMTVYVQPIFFTSSLFEDPTYDFSLPTSVVVVDPSF